MGTIDIVNYTNQALSPTPISTVTMAGLMAVTPDHNTTIVFDQSANGLTLIDNKTEAPATAPSLPAATSSIVISPDSKTAWFATRNALVSGAPNGAVQVLDLTNANTSNAATALNPEIPVPLALTLALSPDGKKMLVFSDQTDTVTFIDV